MITAPSSTLLRETLGTKLALFFDYPCGEIIQQIDEVLEIMHTNSPQIASYLEAFKEHASKRSIDEMEELWAQTFDILPSCIPYLGIHLFGEESFKRGAFMATMKDQCERFSIPLGTEMSDHLKTTFHLFALLPEEEAKDFARYCLLFSMEKMIGSLQESHPYRNLLVAMKETILLYFPNITAVIPNLHEATASCKGFTGCGGSSFDLEKEL